VRNWFEAFAFHKCNFYRYTKEFLATLTGLCRSKDKIIQITVARYFSLAGSNGAVRERILEENVDDQVWLFVKSKDPHVMKLGRVVCRFE
jgi:hypothetical protein